MSSEENKEIALSIIEALNTRNLAMQSKHLAEDYTAEHPGSSVPLNKTMTIGYNQRFVTAFPDIHFEVLGVLAEGDHVLIRQRASGTHTERLATLTGQTIPPTRRSMTVSGVGLAEVRGGKIVREWSYWDQLSLLAQLGITEQPGLFLPPEGYQIGRSSSLLEGVGPGLCLLLRDDSFYLALASPGRRGPTMPGAILP